MDSQYCPEFYFAILTDWLTDLPIAHM